MSCFLFRTRQHDLRVTRGLEALPLPPSLNTRARPTAGTGPVCGCTCCQTPSSPLALCTLMRSGARASHSRPLSCTTTSSSDQTASGIGSSALASGSRPQATSSRRHTAAGSAPRGCCVRCVACMCVCCVCCVCCVLCVFGCSLGRCVSISFLCTNDAIDSVDKRFWAIQGRHHAVQSETSKEASKGRGRPQNP